MKPEEMRLKLQEVLAKLTIAPPRWTVASTEAFRATLATRKRAADQWDIDVWISANEEGVAVSDWGGVAVTIRSGDGRRFDRLKPTSPGRFEFEGVGGESLHFVVTELERTPTTEKSFFAERGFTGVPLFAPGPPKKPLPERSRRQLESSLSATGPTLGGGPRQGMTEDGSIYWRRSQRGDKVDFEFVTTNKDLASCSIVVRVGEVRREANFVMTRHGRIVARALSLPTEPTPEIDAPEDGS